MKRRLDRLARSCYACPTKTWKLSQAKNELSKVAELAQSKPQEITIAGKSPLVLIRKDSLAKLTPGSVDEFFDRVPKLDELAEIMEDLEP